MFLSIRETKSIQNQIPNLVNIHRGVRPPRPDGYTGYRCIFQGRRCICCTSHSIRIAVLCLSLRFAADRFQRISQYLWGERENGWQYLSENKFNNPNSFKIVPRITTTTKKNLEGKFVQVRREELFMKSKLIFLEFADFRYGWLSLFYSWEVFISRRSCFNSFALSSL